MNSEKYWARRADARERAWHKKSQETIEKELARYYARSLAEIQKDIQALYGRFAADNHLSQVEARKLLQGQEFREWRYTIQEYVKQINAGNTGLLKELNTLAMRSRISRLDKLYSDTVMELDSLGRKTSASMKKFLSDAYKDNYYQSMYEIGRTVGLKSPRVVVSSKSLEDVLRDRWSGKNYSERIWKNQKLLGQTLKQEMVTAVHRGESVEAVSKRIAQRMNVSTKNATRLVRTELNYVENRAALDSIRASGMDYYRFIATLDNRTTPICREHDGRIVSVEEASPGDNLPPLHPNCRSTIAGSLYGPEDGHKQEGKRIARDEKGRNYYVPADMTYSQWHDKYVVKAQVLPKNPHAGKAVLVDITPESNGGDAVKVYEGEKIPHRLATEKKLKEPITFDLTDPRYKIAEDQEGVERVKKFVNDVMNVNAFDAAALKNADVIEPFLEYFQELNEAYDNVGKLNKITVIDLGFSDFAEVVGQHLILNANYFNSKLLAEDGIKEFIKRNILPSKADLKFIAAHEWAHCATQEFLDNHPRSKLHLLYQRKFGKYLTGNSAFDVYEFTADALAAWLRKIPCKYAKTVVNLLKKEGVLEYVSDK
ncbi:MAG: minor capsid protein [Acidaminococcus provencensis]|jgi:SPP1 gp7 family putative phage head morphogenesis protein|uniref:minor capsid protein n=1 Tax=Acidaminococcus provencensis TaxID=2058289 RepID=UPI0023F23A0A|nr:minor capsid protein [Acidaminococcus provencensis]MCH4095154.1 minor capsid protein [Acidaminococcus provencensis]